MSLHFPPPDSKCSFWLRFAEAFCHSNQKIYYLQLLNEGAHYDVGVRAYCCLYIKVIHAHDKKIFFQVKLKLYCMEIKILFLSTSYPSVSISTAKSIFIYSSKYSGVYIHTHIHTHICLVFSSSSYDRHFKFLVKKSISCPG